MLEVYQNESKDNRELTEVRLAERKLQEENKKLIARLAKQHENNNNSGGNKLSSSSSSDKLGAHELAKALENEKKEGAMLRAEMEEITKVFEEVQEQNSRLISQLTEKEDANTKLISDVR